MTLLIQSLNLYKLKVRCQIRCIFLSDVPLSASQEELKLEQRADPSLEGLFDMVLPEDEVKNNSHGYFFAE